MPNRKTARTTPKAIAGFLTYPTETALGTFFSTVKIGSAECLRWLKSSAGLFAYTSQGMTFTVRRETKQRGGAYWIGYKKMGGKQFKRYIGLSEQVTTEKLDEIADHFRQLQKSRSEQDTQL